MDRVLTLIACVATALLAVPVSAQSSDAERLFREGTTALQEGRLPEARVALEASLDLNPHPGTGFNLMMTLTDLNELLAASGLCHRLLDDDFGELGDRRVQVERLCESLWAEIPVVELTVQGAPEIRLVIDGEAQAVEDGESVTRQLDPGRHVLRVEAPEHEGEERALDLDRRERLSLVLQVVSAADTKRRRIWIAALLAGGLVLAGAAIGVGLALRNSGPSEQPPDFTAQTLSSTGALVTF